jgi:chromosome segregation ATPase
MGALDTRMGALETRLIALDTRMDSFALRMDALEGRMGALETRMDVIEERLTSLEERVDKRFLQTQPIWETVRLNIVSLDDKFSLVIRDLYDVRRDVSAHEKLLKDHERRLNN